MSDRFITRKVTREKRKSQICKVYELKVDRSHLSQKSINHLSLLFREAKWFYNYIISLPTINDADTKIKTVPVKVKDVFENRELSILASHMKQAIKTRIFTSIKTLSTLKKKGNKVGRLKYKSFVGSIPLPEYHKDFDININKKIVRLTGLKQKLKVRGLQQIPAEAEIANAVIIKKDKDYYFHITTFINKINDTVKESNNNSVGIDFGCETQLTLSNGIKIKFQVPVTDKIKRLDRKIDKKVNGKIGRYRGSNNRKKLQAKRRHQYAKVKSKKKDIRNKVVSAIKTHYKYVCVQDESIHAWHAGGHGKKIQNTAIGGIIRDLKHKSHTPIVVDKYFASTQICPQCGKMNKMPEWKRVYECDCGYTYDRDIKSAQCIHWEGMQQLNKDNKLLTDHKDVSVATATELKLEEILPSAIYDTLMKIDGIVVSKVESWSQEALGLAPR